MLEGAIERKARLFWLGLGETGGERLELLVASTAAMARARGGAPVSLESDDTRETQSMEADGRRRLAVSLWEGPGKPRVAAVAKELGTTGRTVYRYLRKAADEGLLRRPLREYKGGSR